MSTHTTAGATATTAGVTTAQPAGTPPPHPVCLSAIEGAIPPQTVTLPHTKFPISEKLAAAAPHNVKFSDDFEGVLKAMPEDIAREIRAMLTWNIYYPQEGTQFPEAELLLKPEIWLNTQKLPRMYVDPASPGGDKTGIAVAIQQENKTWCLLGDADPVETVAGTMRVERGQGAKDCVPVEWSFERGTTPAQLPKLRCTSPIDSPRMEKMAATLERGGWEVERTYLSPVRQYDVSVKLEHAVKQERAAALGRLQWTPSPEDHTREGQEDQHG